MAHFRRREIDLPDPVDPAVTPVLDAARDTTGAVDTVALERALAAFRVAGEGTAAAADDLAEKRTRRHRLAKAFAATTIGTKVVVGVATAAALGGIGVAVSTTVDRPSPAPSPTVSTATPSTGPTGPSSGATSVPPSGSPTASPTGSVSDSISPSGPTPTSGGTAENSDPLPSTSRSRPPSTPAIPPSPVSTG